jgi:magnesium chelatase family protein
MEERNPGGCANAALPPEALANVLGLEGDGRELWETTLEQRHLSARSALRMLRVARTIADLHGQRMLGEGAIAEALTYRSFDLRTEGSAGSG